MRTAILLGAGASQATGYPSTECLTKQVLSGRGVVRQTNSSYCIDDTFVASDDTPDPANIIDRENSVKTRLDRNIANWLYEAAKSYYASYHEYPTINYEELFYLAGQACDDYAGEMENPAIHSFTRDLQDYIVTETAGERYKPLELCRETRNYIADIVWHSLGRHEPEHAIHLERLARVCRSGEVTSISTLCHDNHVERFLRECDIALSDGFSEPENDVRYWKGDFPAAGTIPFLKLHGSVDWFRFRPDGGNLYDDRIGIPPPDVFYDHTETPDGDGQIAADYRPILLIGTFNKISQYTSGMFLDLHYRFRATLGEADQLVICGYGFRDKRINEEIIDWIYGRRGRRLVIIHPSIDELVSDARGVIRNHWQKLTDDNRILPVRKRFEETEEADYLG